MVLAAYEEGTWILEEVYTRYRIALDDIIYSLAGERIKQVKLGFTPLDATGYNATKLGANSDKLFVHGDKAEIFKGKQWMFPVI